MFGVLFLRTHIREVCMSVGCDLIMDPGGVYKFSELLNDYFAPEAAASVSREGVPSCSPNAPPR